MKRLSGLFEDVTSYQNLLIASRLAMQGSGKTSATCRFFFHLEKELVQLQHELHTESYHPGKYRYFTIHDPKERTIAVAPFRDRVVHHAIVRILTPIYEKRFICDSYATRPQKGTHMAILRAQLFLRKYPWYFKTDIEKYFDSVDHDILLTIINRKIKDKKLTRLLERIVRNTLIPSKSLPIGNLTSQFLANVYLDPLDHYIKDTLGIKGYLRYMDDFVLFANSKEALKQSRIAIENYLQENLLLLLRPKATFLQRSTHGLSFLGMRVFPNLIRVKPENRKRSLKRLTHTFKSYQKGYIHEERLIQSTTSIIGHLKHFCPNAKISLEAGIL